MKNLNISIHTPHTRCDSMRACKMSRALRFQSTHLIRGVTISFFPPTLAPNISIHTPHTRCDCRNSSARQLAHIISIHTPHTRCDRCYHSSLVPPCISIHTPHTRCDLYCSCHFHCFLVISIHTPHTRCDRQWRSNRLVYLYFNPHTSYEV